jgi:hypothetical protein
MKMPTAVAFSVLAAALVAGVALAQEPSAPQAMPTLPKPGAEQAVLERTVGVWDATVEMFMAPGAAPSVSKGVEKNTMGCGGLCLIGDFTSEMMGQPFTGHGVTAYDAAKKKYVGVWMDSMSLGPSLDEAVYDAAAKTMTGTMEGPNMSGQVTKMVTRGEWKDADTRVWSMYSLGTGGKEVLGLRITYKRRK